MGAYLEEFAGLLAERLANQLRADADRLLDRPELAERLGVAERTIGTMVNRQELPQPLLHTGGVARWSWDQITRYLESRADRRLRRGRGRHER
jgi:predicted DNA-binding transcriptional regulator AlpA